MDDNEEERCGYLKLEIPHTLTQRNDQIVNYQVAKLAPALRHYGMDVIRTSDVQDVKEAGCETYHEVTFEVQAKKFDKRLINAMQKYLQQIHEDGLLPYQRANIVINSSCFFSNELNCYEQDVPLAAIYFGNIQGGTFLNHWEVSFWKELKERNERRRNDAMNLLDRENMNQLFADFEFDKSDMLTVHFKQREEYYTDNRVRTQITAWYQIMIRRNSIRRIIVDPIVRDMHGESRVRIHFDVNCPAFIRKGFMTDSKMKEKKYTIPNYKRQLIIKRGRVEKQFPTDLAIADSPVFTIEFAEGVSYEKIYMIISRLRVRTTTSIEFSFLPSIDCLIWKESPYHKWCKEGMGPTEKNAPIFHDFLEHAFPKQKEVRGSREVDTNRERKFSIMYLIECLLSRGAIVKDQILIDENIWKRFLEIIYHYYQIDDKLCEAALEDLIHMIDGRKRIGSLLRCLDRVCKIHQQNKLLNGLSKDEEREGYQRVRKIIFTPTRVIYVAPETLMGNRVLRKYDTDGTRVLRISFRDDDNTNMRSSKTSDYLIEKTVEHYLKNGVCVAGREFGYLGSSNSQLRDNGAYFMEKFGSSDFRNYREKFKKEPPAEFNPKIQRARKALGRFEKIDNIPKMMARLGQCFTQSRLSGVNLERKMYITICDLVGGKTSNGKEYTFSDGVGMMSSSFAKVVSAMMKFGKGIPCCFQFRFRGMKGVIAVEPLLDELARWSETLKLQPTEDFSWSLNCAFRPSQIKFIAKRHTNDQVEIVKYSSPVPVALNKPFINILDQVSEMQSLECHKRMCNRIEELLDRQMHLFTQFFVDEHHCRNKLKELPRRIDIDYLKVNSGFNLSSEPFFRSLIKASIKFSITRQLRKEQIPIPFDLGRSMLGVVDETGRLQYGQIFVRYTKNIALKLPPDSAVREVLTGTVLLTKNPCIVSGDVRIFEAVDIPELHHMCDVVVFPQSGPRPHPDEMAGSDLDGDEYSIIWDQDLLLDRNETPFDFTSEKKKEAFEESEIERLMRDFYKKYLLLDSVGTISNNHLFLSDQYGLNSKVCMDLAKKNCEAVDFPKSGQPPMPLEVKWREIDGQMVPPERAERVPDFHMGNDHSPVYVSPRLCGKLFREIKSVDDVLKISEERDEQVAITIDESIHVDGYEEYLNEARAELTKYNANLRSIMENYGIRNEGEIMSGCIVDMRNRISEKDQDDMSFYNTNQMIESKITAMFKSYRETFFEQFGGWASCTEKINKNFSDETNVLQHLCRSPTLEMKKKAVAYYKCCYEEAQRARENKKLSFAWVAYDVIKAVKEEHLLNSDDDIITGVNPLYSMLEKHNAQYISDHSQNGEFQDFCRFEFGENTNENEYNKMIIEAYTRQYKGLERVLFLVYHWAKRADLISGSVNDYHVLMMVIMYATRQFTFAEYYWSTSLKKIELEDYEWDRSLNDSDAEDARHLSQSEQTQLLIKFFEFLACRKFRKLSHMSFASLGYLSVFNRGQWVPFHQSALKTYYSILFNLRMEELPVSTDPTITTRTIIRENEPFVIELPRSSDFVLVKNKLKEYTGVVDIQMRCLNKVDKMQGDSVKYLVSTRGTLESVYRLRNLIAVKVPLKTYVTGQAVSSQLSQLCYEKIVNGVATLA